jgi:hypothetical protein
MEDKNYVYVGDGLGIPGLPHAITESQAKAAGLWELLKEAIERGYYVEQEPDGLKTVRYPRKKEN